MDACKGLKEEFYYEIQRLFVKNKKGDETIDPI